MAAEAARVLVARQPIFDARRGAVAYELLYRATNPGPFDGTQATASVIVNGLMSIGLDRLVGGLPAFINFTEEMLRQEYAYLLPKRGVVIELLETIEPSGEVLEHCRRLKDAGYSLALDDFVTAAEPWQPFMELADVIKVDWPNAGAGALRLPTQWGQLRTRWLAEKVETAAEFTAAADAGYHYFQGFFFRRPIIIETRDVPAFKLSYLRVLEQIQAPEIDFDTMEAILRSDVGLSYRLLRYVNSAAFGWRKPAANIRQALVRLGGREFRKWVALVVMVGLGSDQPQELLLSSLLRANLAELLAPLVGRTQQQTELFLTGLFSQVDALVGRPLDEVVDAVRLGGDVREALVDHTGPLGTVLEAVAAYEQGDMDTVDGLAAQLGLLPDDVGRCYLAALERTRQVVRPVTAEGAGDGLSGNGV